MTIITFEGDYKTSAMNKIYYLLRREGHYVEKDETHHCLLITWLLHDIECFESTTKEKSK